MDINIMMRLGLHFFSRNFGGRLIPYNLGVFRYSHPNFNSDSKVPEDDFSLDIIDLSYSTARTICSYHIDQRELYFDIIASLLSHLNFIDPTKTDLVLSESRYKRLRDFSKSTRIGEMAQGINALFIAKRLYYPYIIDFDLAKQKTAKTLNLLTNGKSPDFIVLDNTLTKIGLFESKGNMNGNITRDLSNAMEQINSVKNPPCFSAKIPVCARFQDNNDFSKKTLRKSRKSTINYGFIETTCAGTIDSDRIRKLHYASWFYLVGDFDRVESIINDNVVLPILEENNPDYVLDIETDKQNPIYWVKKPLRNFITNKSIDMNMRLFITSRYFRNGDYRIGIYKSAIDAITTSTEAPNTFQLPEGEINYLKKYPDGTLIYLRNNQKGINY